MATPQTKALNGRGKECFADDREERSPKATKTAGGVIAA
jgi:hypothetical protein